MTIAAPAPAPVPARDLTLASSANGKAISAALAAIQNKTADLGSAVSAWDGRLLGALPITVTSAHLLSQVKHATSTAHASDPLTLDGALAVALATGSLVAAVKATLRIIIDNKHRFDKQLILSPVVLLELELQRRATARFSSAVVDKVPASLRGVAQALVKPIDDAFEEAIDAYRLI